MLELKKNLAIRAIKKDPNQYQTVDAKQATLAAARQLDGDKKLNNEPTVGTNLSLA